MSKNFHEFEREYCKQINNFKLQIYESITQERLLEIQQEVNDYIEEQKFNHFNWVLQEDLNLLEKEITKKLKYIKNDKKKERARSSL